MGLVGGVVTGGVVTGGVVVGGRVVLLGLGEGEGFGDGDGDGEGEGDGLGLGLAVTGGAGRGAGEMAAGDEFRLYAVRFGVGNWTTGELVRAAPMKSCQISAGIDPPKTVGNPSTFCMGTLPRS